MATYIEYELEDGMTILVHHSSDNQEEGLVQASIGDGNAVEKAEKKFGTSLDAVTRMSKILKEKLENLRADEVEVTFGLKTSGKAGNFLIAETSIAANFEVKLKWKNVSKKTE